jgi:hypothetical protein
MELVLGTHHLIGFGGSDTYLLTVAGELQALGHEVTIHALEQGETADLARARGIRVARGERELPERCDAVLVQDGVTAFALADRYPQVPQGFVMHSEFFSIDEPPQVPDLTSAVVVMSDRVEAHAQALAVGPEVVRLRQPIDTRRFAPTGAARDQPRRVLVLGNYLRGRRRELLLAACADLGLECRFIGGETRTAEPEREMAEADVVVGKGRVVLEAMACGRAAYVYDFLGTDGWVTPERYPALESDAFAGQADADALATPEQVRRELGGYRADMGVANRDLITAHHDARDHAVALVALLKRLAAPPPHEDRPLREMARLVRNNWMLDSYAPSARMRTEELDTELDRTRVDLDNAMEIVRAHTEFVATRRYRLAQALGRSADRLRKRRRGSG